MVTPQKTVLLVEDDGDLRALYAKTLRGCGYRVIEAETIGEAEIAVVVVTPDAVETRFRPEEKQYLVNRWRDSKMERVPVIVITAHHDRQDIAAAVVAGVDAFVPKPCPSSVLAAHLDRALRSTKPTRRMRAVVT